MKPEELTSMMEKARTDVQAFDHHINVCTESGCISLQSDVLLKTLGDEVKHRGLSEKVCVKGVGCMGLCCNGPLVKADTTLYQNVKSEHAPAIVDSLSTQPVQELLCDTQQSFFARQKLIVRENSGRVDPESLIDCIAHGAYQALLKVLTSMTPQQVIQEIADSGLRGRGGAGFPTGLKWATVAKAQGTRKYVICNGDEGDPGAFMDRSMMEGDPHRVLEGMAIAAYAVGAQQGVIYVRAEYPLAVKRLTKAINMAHRHDLIGHNIFGTKFDFNVEIRLGAGAFVCGEETALIASVEGKRGLPRPRPPYPANSGLFGCPTLINNVETYANIAPIINNGAASFAQIGTEKSKGTKIFALTGKIKNTGLIEVPMGIKLKDIIYDIAGGIPDGRAFKAVQTGGPSGGCIPADMLDITVDYESLTKAGSIMGSGGMIVMDETSNMVDVARFFMEFCMTESCGKCVPCRVGTYEMHKLLDRICEKRGTLDDLQLLKDLCGMVKQTSLCGLGQSAPNPVLSTLRYFEHEYLDLINQAQTSEADRHAAAIGESIKLEVLS
ncbi:MAG: NADH-ubiquinone oxidoreductase-F iron-sulfur binding region domain-containing protein [Phycisphaerae bacterium]